MTQFKELLAMQYMGSKSRLLDEICTSICEISNISTVVDLFAGSGTIGYALKPLKNIVSNDLEYYSYIFNKAILNGCNTTEESTNDFWSRTEVLLNVIEDSINDALNMENEYLGAKEIDIHGYKHFCDDTPSVFRRETSVEVFKKLLTIVELVEPGKSTQFTPYPCLFLTYYANTYFGIKQCCEIDAICGALSELEDKTFRNVILAALMTSMSLVASTTTHFAQFLKINGVATCKNITEKRSKSIVEITKSVLISYANEGLLESWNNEAKCYNLDYEELLKSIILDEKTLVYADPPYFKEHYSRYYHILNTLCLYDYPDLALNPQTKKLSIGRYRNNRSVSNFGKKAHALDAFRTMISICGKAKCSMIISYSNNSIVDIEDIKNIASQYYTIQVKRFELNHSKQGRTSVSKVDEIVFVCTPYNAKIDTIKKKLSIIKEIQPIVDNPAGMIHNYMARKPYNVVSEIIKHFCPPNGTIYDPMCGSGTTLIESSKLGIQAIGADINPISYRLCKVSLAHWDIQKVECLLNEFEDKVKQACESIYTIAIGEENRIIERCHFNWENGTLAPTKYWYKTLLKDKYSGRKNAVADVDFVKTYNEMAGYCPINMRNQLLIPNSRIAVNIGDGVFRYFCNRNLMALDKILELLKQYEGHYGYEILEVLVSSAINLIKLSDKKASSQMPYWMPKIDVTSRNAIFIVTKKVAALKKGLNYLQHNCQWYIDSVGKSNVYYCPAQKMNKEELPDMSIDLVLTDPPYTDQVPYLEYSQLWSFVMGWDESLAQVLDDELIVSDAQSRNKDAANFNQTMYDIIERTEKAVKPNGYFIMFYHSFDLGSWNTIVDQMHSVGFTYCDQIPTAMPRKSFKTVMSPKSTLDGNYLIVFQKRDYRPERTYLGNAEQARNLAIQCAEKILAEHGAVTTQGLYDFGMLKDSIEKGYLSVLAKNYKTFIDVISGYLSYKNGLWEV